MGRKWKVVFIVVEKYFLWILGWKRVVRDNDFKFGDVMVFEFMRNLLFCFIIFDEDGNIFSLNNIFI